MPRPADWSGTVEGAAGQAVALDLFLPADRTDRAPVVVFIHGFKGFKDWGSWSWMAGQLAAAGLAALTMNLSHNGVVGDGQDFTRLDLFEADRWSYRLADLAATLALVRDPDFPCQDRIDSSRLGLIGHSMGGGLAVLHAARDPGVVALATLAGIAAVERFSPAQEEEMRRLGYATFQNARTNQEMRVGVALLDEIRARPEEYDICAAARTLAERPVRVIQGGQDPAVSFGEASALLEAVGDSASLRFFEDAGHTLGSKHPPDDPPAEPFPAVTHDLASFFGAQLG